MAGGPLIPGLKEFDGPRRGMPRWVWGVIAFAGIGIVVLVLLGLFAGAGPLRVLGQRTEALQAVAYRPTSNAQVIQVAVAIPTEGLCPKDVVDVSAFARGNRIEVTADRTRSGSCAATGIAQDRVWVDVVLDDPLGERQVIRESDRQALPKVVGELGG